MAGDNTKKGGGRGAGGAVAGGGAAAPEQPPKPSGMKVNLFQQASREARAQTSRSYMRAMRGGKTRAADYLVGQGLNPGLRNVNRKGLRQSDRPGYRAPATRLY